MTTGPDGPSLRSRLEPGRMILGSLLEIGIKAYGASAALAVALSDAETVGGKARDAVAAVPSLMERYRAAKYVADNRVEIQAALDYVNQNTPPQAELDAAADRSSETLRDITTTSDSVNAALDSLSEISGLNAFEKASEAVGHLQTAGESVPDTQSIRELADMAEQVSPYVDQVQVLTPVYYGGLLDVVDNFASDEIVSTLVVMALAFGFAVVLGQAVGFWVRRGQPGFIARLLQRWGAHRFQGWYVDNVPYALSPPLYAAARERMQRDIVADPEKALDPEVLRELELYFRSRSGNDPSP